MALGIFTVTFVSGRYPEDGVNAAVAPETCHLPGIDGESVGSGVAGDKAEENVSLIGAPPLAWRAPPAGVTESSVSGPTGAADAVGLTVFAAGLSWLTEVSFSWPDAFEDAAYAQPATSTAVAAPAVAVITRCRRSVAPALPAHPKNDTARFSSLVGPIDSPVTCCLLYTSDAADDLL